MSWNNFPINIRILSEKKNIHMLLLRVHVNAMWRLIIAIIILAESEL
jgi:hypothetical protein